MLHLHHDKSNAKPTGAYPPQYLVANGLQSSESPLITNYKSILNKKVALINFRNHFSNSDDCLELYFSLRFSEKCCVKCGRKITENYRRIKRPDKNGVPKKAFRCRSCGTYIYPLSSTLFEHSSIPLDEIYYVIYSLCSGNSSISATEVSKTLNVSYKTAHRLMMRIRMVLSDMVVGKMKGVVEVDEAFMAKGSKFNNWGGISTRKQPIIGLVERDTKQVKLFLVKNRNAYTINRLIRKNVEVGSTIYTDSWKGYNDLSKHYKHEVIDHSSGEFVRGSVSTNSIESVWAHFKRNIRKAHIQISAKYVHLYLDEAAWRHNSRGKLPMQLFNEILIRSFQIFEFSSLYA